MQSVDLRLGRAGAHPRDEFHPVRLERLVRGRVAHGELTIEARGLEREKGVADDLPRPNGIARVEGPGLVEPRIERGQGLLGGTRRPRVEHEPREEQAEQAEECRAAPRGAAAEVRASERSCEDHPLVSSAGFSTRQSNAVDAFPRKRGSPSVPIRGGATSISTRYSPGRTCRVSP